MNSGDTISRYRIIGPLGKGGMGIVYEAEDMRLRRKVALKFLPDGALSEIERKRFLNEARAAAQVRHPNICPIYDVEEVDGRVFLSMAYIAGETLSRKIKNGLLPMCSVLEWGIELACGIEAAHAAGIVHRDIKSHNVMVDESGRVLILDFGLALLGDEERLTVVGQAVGTPAYMSPEQARGANVDERTDLWALGVVLYEMATGKLPGLTPAPIRQLRPDAGLEFESIVNKALAERVSERWQNAREMRQALERISQEQQESGTRTMAIGQPQRRRPRWVLPLIAVMLVAVLGAAAYWKYLRKDVNYSEQRPDRRIALMPLAAKGEPAQVVSDGLLEVWAGTIGEAERGGQKVWAVPIEEVRLRKLESVEEARRAFGVDLAVTGTAETVGDEVHLRIQLVDTATLKTVREQDLVFRASNALASRNEAARVIRQLLEVEASRAIMVPPKQEEAYGAYLEGRGLMARFDKVGNLDRAVARFEQVVRQDENFALGYVSLSEAFWLKSVQANGNESFAAKALEYARKAVGIDPSLAVAHAKLGMILAQNGQEAEGITALQKALDLSPGNAEAYRELANVYARQGKPAEAERLYLEAIQARPTDWLGYTSLAFFYDDQGRLKEAEDQFRLAGRYAPENAGVMRNLGRIYRMQGKYADAVQQFQRAIQIQPSARTYNSLGLAYYYMHRYRQAVTAIETAIALDDNTHLHWGNLASACAMSPDDRDKVVPALRKGIELAEKALKVTPNSYSIMADLAEYRARLGDRKGAWQEIGRIPESAQGPLASRLVLAYELTNGRREAMQIIHKHFKSRVRLREILDEPALNALQSDREFQQLLSRLKAQD